MDLALLVTLFMLVGLTVFAASFISARVRIALTIAAVICFGIASILHLVVMMR